MCGLCGALGQDRHWSDALAPSGGEGRRGIGRSARFGRLALLNALLGLKGLALKDWHASRYVLARGSNNLVEIDNLAALWPAAERHAGVAFDPLDPRLLEAIAAKADANDAGVS